MNASRKIRIGSLAALAMLGGTLTAAQPAAPSAPVAIAARQAGFKRMGAAMKALGDQLKGDAPVKATMVGAAQTIAGAAREQGRLFPAGSGPASGVKTDALPNVWTDSATFDGQMNKLVAESGKLVAVANGGDVPAIRAQMKVTGAVCGGCHRQFRSDS